MSMKKECHMLKNDVLINDQEEQKEYTDYFSFENLQILLEEQIKILKDTFNITAEKLNDKLTEMADIIILQRIQSEENNLTYKKTPLKKVSKQQTIFLCKTFLSEINPSWLAIFNNLLENNNIIEDRNDPRIKDVIRYDDIWQSIKSNNENYIFAPWQENIMDSISLIHEFTHYITAVKNKGRKDYHELEEFSSIFWEKQMEKFLEKIGYDKEIINIWELNRQASIILNEHDCFSYIYLLKTLLRNNKITMDDKLSWINIIEENARQTCPDYDIEKDYNCSKEELAREEGYDEFKKLLTNELEIIESYSYIVGEYYAKELSKKTTDDKDIIPNMIEITENLPNLSSKEILEKLHINPKTLTKS